MDMGAGSGVPNGIEQSCDGAASPFAEAVSDGKHRLNTARATLAKAHQPPPPHWRWATPNPHG